MESSQSNPYDNLYNPYQEGAPRFFCSSSSTTMGTPSTKITTRPCIKNSVLGLYFYCFFMTIELRWVSRFGVAWDNYIVILSLIQISFGLLMISTLVEQCAYHSIMHPIKFLMPLLGTKYIWNTIICQTSFVLLLFLFIFRNFLFFALFFSVLGLLLILFHLIHFQEIVHQQIQHNTTY